jgi:predicted ATPase/class 3 adenylate cyclase
VTLSPPSGTVTFLFTDIEGSTRWWEAHPEAMRLALARHDELLRAAVGAHGGVVFSTGGDGLAAAFGRAADAVGAALEAQQRLVAEPWRGPVVPAVRMGVHTGEVEERDDDYFGPAVNRAARLMGAAVGGEVVVSLATAELVRGQLPEGVSLLDLGWVELRGISGSMQLFQLLWPGAAARVGAPPAARPVGNLPRGPVLLGREESKAAVVRALDDAPLVTLTGVGGVGKTSLALAAAQEVGPHLPDGAWFCELAAVVEDVAVAPAVGGTLGLRPQAGLTSLELVVRALSNQHCLLVLDNCEHVLEAASELAEAVVMHCPDVRVLATSREALGVVGERLVAVRPLDPGSAVRLFRERAAQHGVAAPVDGGDLVDRLCAELDGLPLAIELAAARSRSMPLPALVERLGERFRLLRGQRRSAERHPTLGATVAWSYDLLGPAHRRLFDRLSVFSGSFDLAAAEAVCADEAVDAVEVDALVAELADKSMVVVDHAGRYLMLETLRQFGEDRLARTGDQARFREAHVRWVTGLVVEAHDGLQGHDEGRWWRRLQADWANVRSAFSWALSNHDIDAAATIATNLLWAATWHDTGEPFLWVDAVAAVPGAEQSPLWPSILGGQAWAAWDRGELERARRLGEQALDAASPGRECIDFLADLAVVSARWFLGETEGPRVLLDQLVQSAVDAGTATLEAFYRASGAILDLGLGDVDASRRAAEGAFELAATTGNPHAMAWALAQVSVALSGLGLAEQAEAAARRAMSIADEAGLAVSSMSARRMLAVALTGKEMRAEAADLLLESLKSMRRKSAWMFAQQNVVYAAIVLADGPTSAVAAQLLGSTQRSAAAGSAVFRRLLDELAERLVGALGPDRFAELRAEGAALSAEHAVLLAEEALAALIASPEGGGPHH